jgi:hypothetical protein
MASKKNRDVWEEHGYILPDADRPHPSLNEDTMLELVDDGSGQVAQAE